MKEGKEKEIKDLNNKRSTQVLINRTTNNQQPTTTKTEKEKKIFVQEIAVLCSTRKRHTHV